MYLRRRVLPTGFVDLGALADFKGSVSVLGPVVFQVTCNKLVTRCKVYFVTEIR